MWVRVKKSWTEVVLESVESRERMWVLMRLGQTRGWVGISTSDKYQSSTLKADPKGLLEKGIKSR